MLALMSTQSALAIEADKTYKNLEKIQSRVIPNEVLDKLKAGNVRYLTGEKRQHNFRSQAKFASNKGQFPLAFILSCVDSRSIPQVIFNQGAGSIFVGRVAGNVLSKNMLASMEYAAHVGTRLVVIMGHTQCGAMGAGCAGKGFGNINHLLAEIKPAVSQIAQEGPLVCNDPNTVNKIAKANVENMMSELLKKSPYLAERITSGQLKLMGAMHNIKSGKVDFFE